MKVLRGFMDVDLEAAETVVSIGNFDGVHIGHQAVINSAVRAAQRRGSMSVVCTFDPHTRVFLRPDAPPRLLETLQQRLDAIETLGVDVVVVIPFGKEVAELPRQQFVDDFLRHTLGSAELHVSEAFTFGAGGKGNVAYLQAQADDDGFVVKVVDSVVAGGRPVSSTRIRDALAEGRVGDAAQLLGRPFSIVGEVVAGAGRGHDLDAPTANLAVDNTFVPGRGVYVTNARLDGARYAAISNVGVRPTFEDDGELTVETHLLDRDMSLYGERMELSFLKKLRDEMQFDSAEALASQIAQDVGQAAEYAAAEGENVRYTADVSSRAPAAEGRRRQR